MPRTTTEFLSKELRKEVKRIDDELFALRVKSDVHQALAMRLAMRMNIDSKGFTAMMTEAMQFTCKRLLAAGEADSDKIVEALKKITDEIKAAN